MSTQSPRPELKAGLRAELAALAGPGRLLTEPADCWPYGYDNSRRQALPQAVVFAADTAQVAALVRLCATAGLPLVARGRGTGTAGATVPDRGGVVLSFERMNRILRISPGDRLAVCEPGVVNADLQRAAGAQGLFWPPDPTSAAVCTIGGNLACNAAVPVMDGYQASRAIRSLLGGDKFPILALTASAFEEDKEQVLAAGCDELLSKPIEAQRLFEAIGRALGLRFEYAETAPEIAATIADLAALPGESRRELSEVAMTLDKENLLLIVNRLRPEYPAEAELIANLAEEFRFDRIQEMLS